MQQKTGLMETNSEDDFAEYDDSMSEEDDSIEIHDFDFDIDDVTPDADPWAPKVLVERGDLDGVPFANVYIEAFGSEEYRAGNLTATDTPWNLSKARGISGSTTLAGERNFERLPRTRSVIFAIDTVYVANCW